MQSALALMPVEFKRNWFEQPKPMHRR